MDRRYINGVGLGIGYVNWLLRRSRIFHEAKLIYLLLQALIWPPLLKVGHGLQVEVSRRWRNGNFWGCVLGASLELPPLFLANNPLRPGLFF